MIRLLGGLVGSALAIALLLLLVGIPQFRAPDVNLDTAIVTLPLRTAPVEPAEADTVENAADQAASHDADEDTVQMATNDDQPGAGILPDGPPVDDSAVEPLTGADIDTTVLQPAAGWYTFWSPFRSEIAAKGFVARLQSVTGLDYRIDKIEAGVYQVAFAYTDEAELAAKLAEITAATGLELASR